jgi:hypothetical protein
MSRVVFYCSGLLSMDFISRPRCVTSAPRNSRLVATTRTRSTVGPSGAFCSTRSEHLAITWSALEYFDFRTKPARAIRFPMEPGRGLFSGSPKAEELLRQDDGSLVFLSSGWVYTCPSTRANWRQSAFSKRRRQPDRKASPRPSHGWITASRIPIPSRLRDRCLRGLRTQPDGETALCASYRFRPLETFARVKTTSTATSSCLKLRQKSRRARAAIDGAVLA